MSKALSMFVLAFSVNALAGNVVTTPSANQTVIQPSNTNLFVNRLDHVAFADQYAAGSNTGGIQEAINSLPAGGGTVFLSATTYTLNSGVTINGNVSLVGSGDATVITTSTNSLNALTIGGSSAKVYDVFIWSTATNPTGSGVLLSGATNTTLRGLHVRGFYDSINLSAGAVATDNVRLSQFLLEVPVNAAILVNNRQGSNNQTDLIVNSGNVTLTVGAGYGLLWVDGTGVTMNDVDMIQGIIGVSIIPGWGATQSAQHGIFHNVQADTTSNSTWFVNPGISGMVKDIAAYDCWASSSTGAEGIAISGNGTCTPGSTVDGFQWVGGKIFNNYGHGVQLWHGGCVMTNIAIQNSDISGNSQAGAGQYDGVFVNPGVNHFSLVGNRIGPDGSQNNNGPEKQACGISIQTGFSDYYVVTANDLSGNRNCGLSNGGNGTHTAIKYNVGQ